MISVNRSRLREDIETNAEFGSIETAAGRGRTVLVGTEPDEKARDYFRSRLTDAGMDVRVDAVGNIVGRWVPDGADPDADPVAAGSHLDSVPEGGIFDGPLGVYAALESVRAIQESDIDPVRPIEVVSFTEEEGQRFDPLLGSKVAAGDVGVEEALASEDDDGVTLKAALEAIGYRGSERVDAAEWDAWFELHVEQRTDLEERDVPVGVVTTITGITQCVVHVEGEANHAGTTSMGDRHDPLPAAAEFVLDLERAANEVVATDSQTAVGTVGSATVRPNGTNVVPGGVELGVDIRDTEYESMNELVDRAEKSLARIEAERDGIATGLDRSFDVTPVEMSERCRTAFHTAGDRAGIETVDLHSGAGHDTMEIGRATDVGLLFARSRDGISHSPREWTDWEDCASATAVLAGAIAETATG
jgi:N-carbamoyl-L-amino-acid hydrolase